MFESHPESSKDQHSMYGKYLTLLSLIYEMQATNDGISYDDIQTKYDVSRRTAERMMKAIVESNVDIEIISKRPKRWRIKQAINAPGPTLEHLAALEAAAKMFKRNGMHEYRQGTKDLSKILKANMEHSKLTRLDADLEALTYAEAFSHRPGPAQVIEHGVVDGLREAIKGCNKISFDYTPYPGKTKRWFNLHPYGFLHGNHTRSYLLAFVDRPKIDALSTFTLSKITRLEVYPDEHFVYKPEFSVQNYLKDCFGVFKEKRTYNVVWRFDAKYTDTVRDWVFHPSQKIVTCKDGRVEVKFKACGLREMAWHVVTWGDIVEVIEPKELIEELKTIKHSIRVPD